MIHAIHLIIRPVTSRTSQTGSRVLAALLITAAAALLNVRATAQGGGARPPDIAGEWRLDQGEDPGQPALADYLGLAKYPNDPAVASQEAIHGPKRLSRGTGAGKFEVPALAILRVQLPMPKHRVIQPFLLRESE